jgi:hypothetical protein
MKNLKDLKALNSKPDILAVIRYLKRIDSEKTNNYL